LKILNLFKKNKTETLLILFSLFFSSWLMFSTFSYNNGYMLIASKAWSDFASHIPLIRSFSLGVNFPPEYPLFPGAPIHYHFLFYLIVGLLEKTGIRIDFALNSLSIIGFSVLLVIVYLFAKLIFKSKAIGVLSVILFLFNGSLSFIYFFKKNYIFSENFLINILNNKNFSSFDPYYGDGIVSAFWNLNIYTNQRHLSLSYAVSLFLIYVITKKMLSNKDIPIKDIILIGLILGISFLLNMAVFTITAIIVFCFAILFKKYRFSLIQLLFIAALIASPFFLYLNSSNFLSFFSFNPGYLISQHLTLFSFINYWLYNLGLHILLIPLGFLLVAKKLKKIFIPFLFIFVIANLFQLSSEMAANHKLINYFMIIGATFSSYTLIYLWRKNFYLKFFVIIAIFFLIISGIIDFFPIYNDTKIPLADYPVNSDVKWVMENTSKNSVFLNSEYLYTPASLAGRKIFLGWPYFAWSQGYNTYKRDLQRKSLLEIHQAYSLCKELKKNNLQFIEIIKNENIDGSYISFLDLNFKKVYENKNTGYIIYKNNDYCK